MNQPIVSVKYSKESSPIESHFHDGHQLIYVVDGSAKITVSGKTYRATPGTLVLISRLESHAIHEKTADYSRYTVQIAPEILRYQELLGEKLFSLLVNRPEQFRHAMELPRAQGVLAQMAEEAAADQPMKEKMLLLQLCQLLLLCCRAYPEQLPENARNLKLMQKIQAYIEKNVAQRITLEALAAQFNLSQSYLSHLFKDITGSSVIGYLTAYRLLMAKRYLAETDWEIGRIVEECGFSDNSNFSRTFKKATGLSPTDFRKQFRK